MWNRTTSLLASSALVVGGLLAQPAAAGTPEVVAGCSATSATAPAFAACVGSAMTVEEATKCFSSGFRDCYGPNNDLRKFVERNVIGPLDDVANGELGKSDKSVWHQIGLPHIKLW